MDGLRELAHRGFPVPETRNSARKYPDLEKIQIRIDQSGSVIPSFFTKESHQGYIDRLCKMRPHSNSTDKATFELVHVERDKAGDPPKLDPAAFKSLSENHANCYNKRDASGQISLHRRESQGQI
jgi:hypothetical protein